MVNKVLGELLAGGSTTPAKGDEEGTKFAQIHAIAVLQLLHDALLKVGEQTDDRTCGEYRIMRGYVVSYLFQRYRLAALGSSINFPFGFTIVQVFLAWYEAVRDRHRRKG